MWVTRAGFTRVKNIARITGVTAIMISAAAAAGDPWMNEADLAATFTGATLEGKYGSGRSFSEVYLKDGSLEYREAAATIAGKWTLEAGAFCTIYDNDSSGGCYRVKKVADNCYEFHFVARTKQQAHARPERPSWTARGSIVGKPGNCTEQHNV